MPTTLYVKLIFDYIMTTFLELWTIDHELEFSNGYYQILANASQIWEQR